MNSIESLSFDIIIIHRMCPEPVITPAEHSASTPNE